MMLNSNKFDKESNPLELMEWVRLSNDDSYRIVKQEVFPNGYVLSTVWVGLDSGNFFEKKNYKPFIFETMLVDPNGDADYRKWRSEDEAKTMHENISKSLQLDDVKSDMTIDEALQRQRVERRGNK